MSDGGEKGSLVQKYQHKCRRGGKNTGAKQVVCLGEEINFSVTGKRSKSPVLKSVGKISASFFLLQPDCVVRV